jgi:hypothetical protein
MENRKSQSSSLLVKGKASTLLTENIPDNSNRKASSRIKKYPTY